MGLEMLRFEGHVGGHVQFGLTVKQNISDFIFFFKYSLVSLDTGHI